MSPVGNASAGISVEFGVRQVNKDLDPQNPIEEVAIVEGEGKVEFGARSRAPTGRDAVKVRIGIVQKKGIIFLKLRGG